MDAQTLVEYLREALRSESWNILVLRNSADDVQLTLNRLNVVQLVRHLEARPQPQPN